MWSASLVNLEVHLHLLGQVLFHHARRPLKFPEGIHHLGQTEGFPHFLSSLFVSFWFFSQHDHHQIHQMSAHLCPSLSSCWIKWSRETAGTGKMPPPKLLQVR